MGLLNSQLNKTLGHTQQAVLEATTVSYFDGVCSAEFFMKTGFPSFVNLVTSTNLRDGAISRI